MCTRFGAKPADICVILGPHIHECCYTVDAERAAYFSREFSPDCCTPVDGGSGVHGAAGGTKFASGGCTVGGNQSAPNLGGFSGNPNESTPSGLFSLSLARANIVSLVNVGIKPENILHCTDCTSCFSLPAAPSVGNATGAKEAAPVADATASREDSTSGEAAPRTNDTTDTHGARFFPYGSFRRQTSYLPEGTPLEERFKVFSAMAAVIGYISQK